MQCTAVPNVCLINIHDYENSRRYFCFHFGIVIAPSKEMGKCTFKGTLKSKGACALVGSDTYEGLNVNCIKVAVVKARSKLNFI